MTTTTAIGAYSAFEAALQGHTPAPCEYQDRIATLDLYSESLILTRYANDGRPATTYELDPRDVVSAFSNQALTTGVLPKNCVFYMRKDGQECYAVVIHPGVHELQIAEVEGKHKVALPPLLFMGKGAVYSIWAIKHTWPGADERLYRAPLPNVNTNGQICFGEVRVPACTAKNVWDVAKLFLEESKFNDHLIDGKSRAHSNDVREGWSEAEYPLDDLVRTNLTLEGLWAL